MYGECIGECLKVRFRLRGVVHAAQHGRKKTLTTRGRRQLWMNRVRSLSGLFGGGSSPRRVDPSERSSPASSAPSSPRSPSVASQLFPLGVQHLVLDQKRRIVVLIDGGEGACLQKKEVKRCDELGEHFQLVYFTTPKADARYVSALRRARHVRVDDPGSELQQTALRMHAEEPNDVAMLVVSRSPWARELCEASLAGRERVLWQHVHLAGGDWSKGVPAWESPTSETVYRT